MGGLRAVIPGPERGTPKRGLQCSVHSGPRLHWSLNSLTSNGSAILIERHVHLFAKKNPKGEKKSFWFKEYSISMRPLKA